MEQFNLDTWLKDKSRKVITRLNKQVQIISTEGRDDVPIIALVEGIAHQYKSNGFHADVIVAYSNQCLDMGDYDLFFADEEEKLTEFEKELNRIVIAFSDAHAYMDKNEIHHYAKGLLDLARKELNLVDNTCGEYALNEAYKQGNQDALKDLPKWKKAKENRTLPDDVVKIDEGGMVIHSDMVWEGEYFIMFQSLKSLPKEE